MNAQHTPEPTGQQLVDRRQNAQRRTWACWNACEGIPTEALEAGVVKDLPGALKSFLRAPSVGSRGPGTSTIVIQEFNRRAARAALAKAQKGE